MSRSLLLCSALLSACTTSKSNEDSAAEAAVVFQYLSGTSITSDPGETIEYENIAVLAKRSIDTANGLIIEDTTHDGEARQVVAQQRPGTLIFDIAEPEQSYEGTITFANDDFLTSSATYDLSFLDPVGTLTGTGEWTDDTYHTNKLYSNASGVEEVRIREALSLITEEEYLALVP